MARVKLISLIAACWAVLCCMLLASPSPQLPAHTSSLLRQSRQSPTDLEVDGIIAGIPESTPHFISYQDLLALPQVAATVVSDENFTEMNVAQVKVTGIYLSELARRIGVSNDTDLISAQCIDHYRAPYPSDYIAIHKPILVLTINGLTASEWARRTGNEDPGPYLITHASFVPSFHILSHQDRPQVPTQVVSLEFARQKDVFEAIRPPGDFAAGSPEMEGFGIARQNCLRCHNRGSTGGTKAGRSWAVLSKRANDDPASFAQYVHDPESVDSKAKMPGNPNYDAATLSALTAYFKTFHGK